MRTPLAFGWTSPVILAAVAALSGTTRADMPSTYCGTERWQGFIQEAAVRSHMEAAWIDAVIRVESAGCETFGGKPTTSRAGAMGLMQLMPATWDAMRRRLSLGNDPYDPHDNILAGTEWLEELHERYGSRGFLEAYSAGPERYEDFLAHRQPLPDETLNYVERVEEALLLAQPDSTPALTDLQAIRMPFVHSRHAPTSGATPFTPRPFVTLLRANRSRQHPDATSSQQLDDEAGKADDAHR